MPLTYEFHMVEISSILIKAGRQRKKLRKIEELASSINRNELLHPIVITRDKFLVAGERRLSAFKLLEREKIPVHYLDEMSPHEAKAIELEENIKRLDLTWQDNCLATEEYHTLRVADDSEWTKGATAEAIGLGAQQVGKLIAVAKALKKKQKQVNDAGGLEAAYRVIRREQSRIVQNEVSQINFLDKNKKNKKKMETEEPSIDTQVFCENFIKWCQVYEGRRFNFVHCDFPYGIGYDKTNYSGSETWDKYSDSPEVYTQLINCLIDNKEKIFFPSAHLMFWFSMSVYHPTLKALEKSGFSVNPFPLVWTKDRGIIPDPQRGPRRTYETAFFCSLGDRKVIKSVNNFSYHKVEKSDHISTKPKAMLLKFFEMFVDESTEILDPTCGSGGSLAAAKIMGAKRIIGLDINKEHVETSRRAIKLARSKINEAT